MLKWWISISSLTQYQILVLIYKIHKAKFFLSFFNWPRIQHFDVFTEEIKIPDSQVFEKSGKKWFWNVKLWLRTSNWYYKLGINMEYPFKISITFCHEGWRTIHSRTFLLQRETGSFKYILLLMSILMIFSDYVQNFWLNLSNQLFSMFSKRKN